MDLADDKNFANSRQYSLKDLLFEVPASAGWFAIMSDKMNVTVNGQAQELPAGITLRELCGRFNLTPEKVAIELNRRLVRSERYDTPLKEGDEVEIVTFVGGG